MRKTLNKIIERPDDMTEVLAYYLNTYGKPIPNSIKKGLADSFGKFDEYQLAKYNRKNAITWETELSSKGNTKETWESLIDGNRLGYMAMMRNLRNIIKSGASNINKVYEYLTDEERVLKNKQLPFRYYSAYKALKNEGIGTSKIYDALEIAIKTSTKNINRLPGKTLIKKNIFIIFHKIFNIFTPFLNNYMSLCLQFFFLCCTTQLCKVFSDFSHSNNFTIRNLFHYFVIIYWRCKLLMINQFFEALHIFFVIDILHITYKKNLINSF